MRAIEQNALHGGIFSRESACEISVRQRKELCSLRASFSRRTVGQAPIANQIRVGNNQSVLSQLVALQRTERCVVEQWILLEDPKQIPMGTTHYTVRVLKFHLPLMNCFRKSFLKNELLIDTINGQIVAGLSLLTAHDNVFVNGELTTLQSQDAHIHANKRIPWMHCSILKGK